MTLCSHATKLGILETIDVIFSRRGDNSLKFVAKEKEGRQKGIPQAVCRLA